MSYEELLVQQLSQSGKVHWCQPTSIGLLQYSPPQGYGVYEACDVSLRQTCLDHLATIAHGGFKLVLNYGQLSGNASEILTYLNTAQQLGLKVIFAINAPRMWDGTNLLTYYSGITHTCGCSTNKGLITYIVNLVKNHPALWGYYIGDEVSSSKPKQYISAWEAYSAFVHQLDPGHPRLLIEGTNTYELTNPDISRFASNTDVVGQDFYPIGYDELGPTSKVSAIAKGVYQIAQSNNKDSTMVLQAMSWQDYYPPARCTPYPTCAPFPSKTQLQNMLSLTLQNSHPQFILWYSYFDVMKAPNATEAWNNLVSVINPLASQPTPTPSIHPTTNPLPACSHPVFCPAIASRLGCHYQVIHCNCSLVCVSPTP